MTHRLFILLWPQLVGVFPLLFLNQGRLKKIIWAKENFLWGLLMIRRKKKSHMLFKHEIVVSNN